MSSISQWIDHRTHPVDEVGFRQTGRAELLMDVEVARLSESAGMNRHEGGDGRALRRRASDPRWPRSHASTTREGVAKRWTGARAGRAIAPRNERFGVLTLSKGRKATSPVALFTPAIKRSDAIFAFPLVRGLTSHTIWPSP
jgi:hypothetical protein